MLLNISFVWFDIQPSRISILLICWYCFVHVQLSGNIVVNVFVNIIFKTVICKVVVIAEFSVTYHKCLNQYRGVV